MQQTTFSKLNTCMAWLIFAIAAVVYGLTVEPTASLWDCPEFIACGYKLEIGHPPGAPFFMLVANLFSQFAGHPSQVALMVNLLSALLSAGCIFFLFLTITHLAGKMICPTGDSLAVSNVITIETCGMVGALAYTFSDTFWFSAVEAEVYAFSSFLTALMFWLILKWEEKTEDRWIILIAYITGLSIGVHLLCLLCLPAMSFVVYFRIAKRITLRGLLTTFVVGGLLVAVILYGIIPGVVKIGMEFCMIPYNFLIKKAAYLNTGVWAKKAMKEAKLFGEVVEVASSADANYKFIPKDWTVPADADYLHITTNHLMSCSMFSMYSVSSFTGFVSSKRRCTHGIVEEVLVSQTDAILKFCLVCPSELGSLADVKQLAWCAVGTGSVPLDTSFVTYNLCHQLSQSLDCQLLTCACIDGFVTAVVVHEEHAEVGEVVNIKELTQG